MNDIDGRAAGTEALRRELEQLGLSPYEARVVLALLRLGTANNIELARVGEVPRTSTYQVLEELNRKGLAMRLPGEGTAVWTSPGRDEVLDQLEALEEERLRQHRARTERVRETLAEAFQDEQPIAMPYVNLIHGKAQAKTSYERLVAQTENEILMFTRPPYSWTPGDTNPAVMDALARGVETLVLYEAAQIEDPAEEAFRHEMEAYHSAGVQARIVEHLPLKLVIGDRRSVLMAMVGPVLAEESFPTTLLVEHEGFAALQAGAFEQRWASGRPYPARHMVGRKPTVDLTGGDGPGRPEEAPPRRRRRQNPVSGGTGG